MKRIISILMVVLLFFSVTASANSLESVAATQNFEAEMNLKITFDKPLKIFNVIPDTEEIETFVNLNEMFQSLIGTTVDAKIKANISEDFSKIRTSVIMTSSTPLKLNQSATITGDFVIGMWIDADFSDEENPVFDIILQAPYFNKYIAVDFIELLEEEGMDSEIIISRLKELYNKEQLRNASIKAIYNIKKNATITESNNTLNIVFDKNDAKQYLCDSLELSMDTLDPYYSELYGESYRDIVDGIILFFKGFNIFGDDGIKMQYTFDRAGNIKTFLGTTDIDIDLYPLLVLSGIDMTDVSREDCLIDFTMTESIKYSQVGNTVVDFPELTEDNSINLSDFFVDDYYPPEEYEEYPPYYIWTEYEYATLKNDTLYAGIRGFLEDVEAYHYYPVDDVEHFEYDYTDGVLTVKNNGCKFINFTELVIKTGETTVNVDGKEIVLESPVEEINDRVFLSTDFYEKAFNFKCIYASHELFDDAYSIEFERIEE